MSPEFPPPQKWSTTPAERASQGLGANPYRDEQDAQERERVAARAHSLFVARKLMRAPEAQPRRAKHQSGGRHE